MPSILRISSGDGIPGVGVAPGFAGLIFEPSGIPGVGVAPFGTAPFEFTPGTFAGCCIGLAESPGGRLAGSSLTATGAALVAVVFAAVEALEFAVLAAPPQANEKDANRASVDTWTVLFIFTMSVLLQSKCCERCGFDYSLRPTVVNRFDLPNSLIYTYKFARSSELDVTYAAR